jgi:3-oxoacid CoA-transferase subunit A
MATASNMVIAEVEEIVKTGELNPNYIHTPGIYIDRIVKGENYIKFYEHPLYQLNK